MKRTATQATIRATDLLLILASCPVWFPLMVVTGLACLATQGRPVLFTQLRLGINAGPIKVFKFRTMINNADEFLDENGVPTRQRVTPLGKYLRRTGLDEIPQLINILKGDMSIVGPRPVIPEWEEKIPGGSVHPRFNVRPGLTGLAQIEGRNAVKWSRRLELDSIYATRPSYVNYLKIIAMTPAAVFRPTVSHDRNISVVNDL